MVIPSLLLVAATLLPGGLLVSDARSATVPVSISQQGAAPSTAALVTLAFALDPRDVPRDPSQPFSIPVRERATEELEEEANPGDGLVAWWVPDWRLLLGPSLSLSGIVPLPGGKVLPQLLPNLRC